MDEQKKNVKLRFRLEKWEKALVFQVLEMDERFKTSTKARSAEKTELKEYKSLNGIRVRSCHSPFIQMNYSKTALEFISLRGTYKESDIHVDVIPLLSNEDRDTIYQIIIEALKDWAKNWEGFNETKKPEPVDSAAGIFEV